MSFTIPMELKKTQLPVVNAMRGCVNGNDLTLGDVTYAAGTLMFEEFKGSPVPRSIGGPDTPFVGKYYFRAVSPEEADGKPTFGSLPGIDAPEESTLFTTADESEEDNGSEPTDSAPADVTGIDVDEIG